MTPRNITEEFVVNGEWWTPECPADRVRGTLTYKPHSSPELEILRCFPSLPPPRLMGIARTGSKLPLLLGQSDDGLFWSALQCLPTKMGTEDAQPVHFYCQNLLSGYAHAASTPIQFDEVHMRCTKMAEWLRPFPPQSVKMPRLRFDFSVHPKRQLRAKITQPSGVLSLHSWFNPEYKPGGLTIHSEAQWSFASREGIDLRGALKLVRDCQNFISFVLGEPSDITRVHVLPKRTAGLKGPLRAAELIYPATKSGSKAELFPPDALFRFDDLGPSPGKVVAAWFALQPKIREAVSLVLASRYVRGYVTTEFLNLIQALESLHRRLQGGTYCSEEEYAGIRKSLIAAVPRTIGSDLRQRLTSSYQYANEFSLRRRLSALSDSLAQATRYRIAPDLKGFFEKVIKTRNYLTHLDEQSRTGSFLEDEDELLDISRGTQTLMALATTVLAKTIGISEESAASRAFRP